MRIKQQERAPQTLRRRVTAGDLPTITINDDKHDVQVRDED